MSSKQCLYCYNELPDNEVDFHSRCSRRIFGTPQPPNLPYMEDQLADLAQKVISSHEGITGVQPKLSLGIAGDGPTNGKRFTIVGALGQYILKPHTAVFPTMPEVEDLTMHLATLCGISTVPHSLIRMQSGNLAYITRRIDRKDGGKIHMEDMCQLSGRLTEDKYRGSYEQIARVIYKYSDIPGLDIVNFFEQIVFSFLTGNADMHLKNFSLIYSPDQGSVLSPAYDMVSTALLLPTDDEDLALTLNGKKKRLKRADFDNAAATIWLDKQQVVNIYRKMQRFIPKAKALIDKSFLTQVDKTAYKAIILERAQRLEL